MIMLPCLLIYFLLDTVFGHNLRGISIGYPDKWTGDKYKDEPCEIRGFPDFLDGYFLCQLSAAYGNEFDPPGQKLTHMIDAMGAIGSFHLSHGEVRLSGAYYPARPYKIWDFYDRDLRQSTVAWNAGWSPWNKTAAQIWEPIQDPDMVMFHPNVDFWKIGRTVIGGTESPYWVGLGFDVPTLDNFKKFPFIDTNEIFRNPDSSPIKLLNMPIHERTDENGVIWASTSAFNPIESKMYQIVFSVAPSGLRTIEGMYDYGQYDLNLCGSSNEYLGDKGKLAGYMHSITSTQQYVILPITSSVINPCKWFREQPAAMKNSSSTEDIQPPGSGLDFDNEVPMRFLIFNKRTKRFETRAPLEAYPSMWVSHQWNAYERTDGTIVADMLAYDNADAYNKYLYVDFLKRQPYPALARPLRFTIDIHNARVKYDYLLPDHQVSMEFTQFNHDYEGKPYQYGYGVVFPFSAGSKIIKINMDDPQGRNNLYFSPGPQYSLSEPWYVPRPGSSAEDDGILLVRAIDTQAGKGLLFAVDARTMAEEGRATAPIPVPFGFHNRYYSKRDLGLPPGKPSPYNVVHPKSPITDPSPRWNPHPPPVLPPPQLPPPFPTQIEKISKNVHEVVSNRPVNKSSISTIYRGQNPYSNSKYSKNTVTSTSWPVNNRGPFFPPRTFPTLSSKSKNVIPLIPSFPRPPIYVPRPEIRVPIPIPRRFYNTTSSTTSTTPASTTTSSTTTTSTTTTTTEAPYSLPAPEVDMDRNNMWRHIPQEKPVPPRPVNRPVNLLPTEVAKKIPGWENYGRPRERGVHLKPGDLSGMYDRGRRALCGWFREIFDKMGSDFCVLNLRKQSDIPV